jgi:putative inorganic carbon (hco3(-)) transporter
VLSLREDKWLLLFGALFIAGAVYGIWHDSLVGVLLPYALIVLYVAVFYTEYTFFLIVAATPLSVNIEEYVEGFGLFLPTEPLLAGTMLLLLIQSLYKPVFPSYLRSSPIFYAVVLYLLWIFFTSITSAQPVVSFKYLVMRLWFIIPVLFYGSAIFYDPRKIKWFLWLFLSGMMIAILYTLAVHASYRFGEKEGHWVMWPFFKDHTIYGAIVALIVPLVFAFYFSKKHSPIIQLILIGFIMVSLLGLYFSYTRAAWLSVILAIGIWALIRFRVKFSLVAGALMLVLGVIWYSWTDIQQSLERNKFEHTTEEFGEKLQSATNVTTDASNLERINRWSAAIAMFRERPLTGFGPGTYAMEYAPFQEPENLTIISTNFGDVGNAHSEYLGPLAETGLPGLLFTLAVIVAIFYQGITLYHAWPVEDRETRTLLMGMILSLSTYFIHGLLNNYLDTDKAAVPIYCMCAVFIALDARLKRSRITEPADAGRGTGEN